jgi:hypothetical protein
LDQCAEGAAEVVGMGQGLELFGSLGGPFFKAVRFGLDLGEDLGQEFALFGKTLRDQAGAAAGGFDRRKIECVVILLFQARVKPCLTKG